MSVLRIAHRAGNDLGLIAPAVELGADVIEADVQARGGRLEVRHARSLGRLPYLWEPFYLVKDLRLQLADLRAAVPPGAVLMLDLKGGPAELGDLVRAAMSDAEPYVVCSRAWPVLQAFAGLPEVRVVHSARTQRELQLLPGHLRHNATWGVSLHRGLLRSPVVQQLRPQVETVMSWPIDSVAAYEEVVGLGANGVISNDLAALPPR